MEVPSLISIIMPIYMVEGYLPKCIESILKQTYSTFELLLIDDGSPDRCGQICDEYALQDAFFIRRMEGLVKHVIMAWTMPKVTMWLLWIRMIGLKVICWKHYTIC